MQRELNPRYPMDKQIVEHSAHAEAGFPRAVCWQVFGDHADDETGPNDARSQVTFCRQRLQNRLSILS
jgi:hypothetical protein